MSQRRAVNRTERRHLHQEMHLVRRGLECVPDIYTDDELNAARREVIESISDRRYRTLARDIAILTDDCEELDERVDDVRRILMSTRELLRSAVFGIHDDQRLMRTKLNTLTTVVNAIAKTIRNQASPFGGDLTRCLNCGAWYERSHGCATGRSDATYESITTTRGSARTTATDIRGDA